jgi:hypothetical protein
MDTEEDVASRNYSKYFSLLPQQQSPRSNSLETEEDITLGASLLTKNIFLPMDFSPRDMAYHEIGEDMVLLGICGGNKMIFTSMQKHLNDMFIIPQRIELNFDKKGVEEFLMVVKSGFMYIQEKGISKIDEIFVTAGKCGMIYIFIFRHDDKEMIKLEYFEAHLNQINDISFVNSLEKPHLRNLLVSCSNDGSTVIWDLLNQQALVKLFPHVSPLDDVIAVDWSDNGDEIITSSLDLIRIWKLDKEIITFLKLRDQQGPEQNFKSKHIKDPWAKIKNFHQFYIDSVKLMPNGAIATKSINGEVCIWTFEMDQNKSESFPIILSKYATFSNLNIEDKIGFGVVRPQVLGLDNLIVLPQDIRHKVKIHYMRNKYDLKAYAEFSVDQKQSNDEKFKVLKALVPEGGMDSIFVLTNNAIWYGVMTRLDESLGKENDE